MAPSAHFSRRRLLRSIAGAATLGSLAGCQGPGEPADGSQGGSDPTDTDSSEAEDTPSDTDGDRDANTPSDTDGDRDTNTPSDTGGEIDLREANVVAVEFDGENGTHTFDVTLQHDDDGEDGYANWWQVERLDGTRLGRRELLHPHSNQPFTRSETIDIPGEVSCVVVRGHDQTHGYGGQAMLVNLGSGSTRAARQGSDRTTFESSDCP